MTGTVRIYVSLVGEGVAVWRPMDVEHLHDDVYRVLDQPYDRELEEWEFAPGDEVIAELVDTSDGRVLAATRRANQ